MSYVEIPVASILVSANNAGNPAAIQQSLYDEVFTKRRRLSREASLVTLTPVARYHGDTTSKAVLRNIS